MTATRWLNYPGHCHAPAVVGPDIFGGLWTGVTANYDPHTNLTRVGLVPLAAAPERVDRQVEQYTRIQRLFSSKP